MPRRKGEGNEGSPVPGPGNPEFFSFWENRIASRPKADWTAVDGRWVCAAAAALGLHGGAIRLGYTRDGGAYAIGVYLNDDHKTHYLQPDSSIEEFLSQLVDALSSLNE